MSIPGKNSVFGSTSSLHVLSGETIPREYHRKVLKKIAQLTKVVHSLHTRNDELEERMQLQSSAHESEKQCLISESLARQLQCKEEKERKLELLTKIEAAEDFKKKMLQEQEEHSVQVEKQFQQMKQQLEKQLLDLSRSLAQTKQQLASCSKEAASLQQKYDRANEDLTDMEKQRAVELSMQRNQMQEVIDSLRGELTLLKDQSWRQLREMNEKHRNEINQLRKTMSTEQNTSVELEAKRWEERHRELQQDFITKESALNQQVSNLAKELAKTRDQLALSEQRVRDLEKQLDETCRERDGTAKKLHTETAQVQQLRERVNQLQKDVSVGEETCQQRDQEISNLSTHLAELEAIRSSHERTIDDMQRCVTEQSCQLQEMQQEQQSIMASSTVTAQWTSQRVQVLEKEVERLGREKRELRAQYAREIEAAQAELGEKHSSMGQEYLQKLQLLKEQHQLELLTVQKKYEEAMSVIRIEAENRYKQEIESLNSRHQEEMDKMKALVSERTSELLDTQAELQKIKSFVAERENTLGSAALSLEGVREQLTACKVELRETKQQRDESLTEIEQLKASLAILQEEHKKAIQSHAGQLEQAKLSVARDAQQLWQKRMSEELAELRAKLTRKHDEDYYSATAILTEQKDIAFKEAEQKWSQEIGVLIEKIKTLENELKELHIASNVALKKAESEASHRITVLQEQAASEKKDALRATEDIQKKHEEETTFIKLTTTREKSELREQLEYAHRQELLSFEQANQLAVSVLREELERQKHQQLKQNFQEHQAQMEALQGQLRHDQEASMSTLESKHQDKLHRCKIEMLEKIKELEAQVVHHGGVASGLQFELETRQHELSDRKVTIEMLTRELHTCKREMEMKQQEMISVRIEASNLVRLREEQLSLAHQSELDSLDSQHKHRMQLLLKNFNSAKELLNRKVADAERRLFEAELKYKSRDPRPEDLKKIRELQRIARDLEQRIKVIVSEKRIYELELANREKNYNKLFNVNPHIGVLDPLQFKKKGVADGSLSSGSLRHASAPSLCSSLTTTADTPYTPSVAGSSSLAKQQSKPYHTNTRVSSHPLHSGHIPDLPGLIPSPNLSPVSGRLTKRVAFLSKEQLSSEVDSKGLSTHQGHDSLSSILPQGTVVQ